MSSEARRNTLQRWKRRVLKGMEAALIGRLAPNYVLGRPSIGERWTR
jgi:hypothetical protein